jgi:hypothetical protein
MAQSIARDAVFTALKLPYLNGNEVKKPRDAGLFHGKK